MYAMTVRFFCTLLGMGLLYAFLTNPLVGMLMTDGPVIVYLQAYAGVSSLRDVWTLYVGSIGFLPWIVAVGCPIAIARDILS